MSAIRSSWYCENDDKENILLTDTDLTQYTRNRSSSVMSRQTNQIYFEIENATVQEIATVLANKKSSRDALNKSLGRENPGYRWDRDHASRDYYTTVRSASEKVKTVKSDLPLAQQVTLNDIDQLITKRLSQASLGFQYPQHKYQNFAEKNQVSQSTDNRQEKPGRDTNERQLNYNRQESGAQKPYPSIPSHSPIKTSHFQRKPISKIECFTCHELGHFSTKCPNKVKREREERLPPPPTQSYMQNPAASFIKVKVNGCFLHFLLDSGSSSCFVSEELARKLGLPMIPLIAERLIEVANGQRMTIKHCTSCNLNFGNLHIGMDFFVSPHLPAEEIILGLDFFICFGVRYLFDEGVVELPFLKVKMPIMFEKHRVKVFHTLKKCVIEPNSHCLIPLICSPLENAKEDFQISLIEPINSFLPDTPQAGHLRMKKILQRVRNRFLWPCWKLDVDHYVASKNSQIVHKHCMKLCDPPTCYPRKQTGQNHKRLDIRLQDTKVVPAITDVAAFKEV